MKVERQEIEGGYRIIYEISYAEIKELQKQTLIMDIIPKILAMSLITQIKESRAKE